MIWVKFNESANKIIGKITKPTETLYEIIWAAVLANFET
jgi:hypothetical protein